ncbi:MAG: shikimate dehydrogenase [Alphaproteobacteria bacterium]|jgi:shikimate dehydrogenase
MIEHYIFIKVYRLSTRPAIACVFGNPIEQSKSPIIHAMFAKQFDMPLDYQKRLAPVDGFALSAEQFFTNDACIGANVTMPFKLDALKWVDTLSSQAKRAGAVNTIIKKADGFIGDNTDGEGLVADLHNHGVDVNRAKILMIGAGGAAKGALPALVDAGINSVSIYNRSPNKAKQLVAYTNSYANKTAQLYEENSGELFDIVINATSLSLQDDVPDLPDSIFANQPSVYDMVYLPKPTAFMQKANKLGCATTIDGLGMLVNQAAQSFYLWFDYKPNCEPVYKYLRALNAN